MRTAYCTFELGQSKNSKSHKSTSHKDPQLIEHNDKTNENVAATQNTSTISKLTLGFLSKGPILPDAIIAFKSLINHANHEEIKNDFTCK